MTFKIKSSNKEILHKLEFLFFSQIEEDIEMIFANEGEYVIEYDPDGGVLGLVLKTTKEKIPEWRLVDTTKSNNYQCLNRIAMVHLMCFFGSPSDFSNFHIEIDNDVACECGSEKTYGKASVHSYWCPKFQ